MLKVHFVLFCEIKCDNKMHIHQLCIQVYMLTSVSFCDNNNILCSHSNNENA